MSPEINEAGYERLRQLINTDLTSPGQWTYMELQEEDGTIVWRGSTAGEWTTSATDQTQTVEITVEGSDIEAFGTTLPVDITTSVLKDTDTDAADELADDDFEEATIAESDDSLVITHEVEVPQV